MAGPLLTGDQPLVGLGGTVLGSARCLGLVLASWLVSVLPVLAFTSLALLFSVATRHGIAGVLGPVLVGLVMQLLALVGSGSWVHARLVASAFDDWRGLLTGHVFYGPLILESVVSVAWVVVCLGASWVLFRRRDFAGTPVARRPGWVVAVRVVVGSAALIAVLAAATSLGPAAITESRLEASMTPTFNGLTLLQQRLLGRSVPSGAKLRIVTESSNRRHNSTLEASAAASVVWSLYSGALTALAPGKVIECRVMIELVAVHRRS